MPTIYKKVDPSQNQNLLISQAVKKKIKDFILAFQKDNGRLPMISEISEGTGSRHREVTKHTTEGIDYLTKEEGYKIKKSGADPADLTSAQKKWYAANKDYLFVDKKNNFIKGNPDFMSLDTTDRYKVRRQYKNRASTGLNHPRAILVVN